LDLGANVQLTSVPFELLVIALAGLFMTLAVVSWDRFSRATPARIVGRIVILLACQVSALVALGVVANNYFFFYGSWQDLLGGKQPIAIPSGTTGPVPTPVVAGFAGRIRKIRVTGGPTGLSTFGFAYLPPEYYDPAYAKVRFPVVVTLTGFPGHPQHMITRAQYPQALQTLLAQGKAHPVILLMLSSTVVPPRDTECADVAGGPQVETFFLKDVPTYVAAHYRAQAGPGTWAFMGDSTGGYCALKFAMRHPDQLTSAASMSGLYNAVVDPTTGALYGGDQQVRNLNDPLWRIKNLPSPPISVLLTTGTAEPSYKQLLEFTHYAKSPMSVSRIVVPNAGHNPRVWKAEVPLVLAWLTSKLPDVTGGRTSTVGTALAEQTPTQQASGVTSSTPPNRPGIPARQRPGLCMGALCLGR
jgi:S-formylglutathione hydrolase FrmB